MGASIYARWNIGVLLRSLSQDREEDVEMTDFTKNIMNFADNFAASILGNELGETPDTNEKEIEEEEFGDYDN